MPNIFEINNRIYEELKNDKEFIKYLKNNGITKNFIKPYLKENVDDTAELGNSWVEFVEVKNNKKLGIFVLTHGLESDGRLGFIYEKKDDDDHILNLIYWNIKLEPLSKIDISKILNSL